MDLQPQLPQTGCTKQVLRLRFPTVLASHDCFTKEEPTVLIEEIKLKNRAFDFVNYKLPKLNATIPLSKVGIWVPRRESKTLQNPTGAATDRPFDDNTNNESNTPRKTTTETQGRIPACNTPITTKAANLLQIPHKSYNTRQEAKKQSTRTAGLFLRE